MTNYNENIFSESNNLYTPVQLNKINNYNLDELIDTRYYKKQATKITAETYVYIRQTN